MLPLLVTLLLLIGAPRAAAELVTLEYQGFVTQVSGFTAPPFQAGDAYTLGYTFETTTPDSNGSAEIGSYTGAVTSFSFQVGTYSGGDSNRTIEVRNDDSLNGGRDKYSLNSIGWSGAAIEGKAPSTTSVSLPILYNDPSGTAFSSIQLPAGKPSVYAFPERTFILHFEGGAQVRGVLVATTAVPALSSAGIVLMILSFIATAILARGLLR